MVGLDLAVDNMQAEWSRYLLELTMVDGSKSVAADECGREGLQQNTRPMHRKLCLYCLDWVYTHRKVVRCDF
jgi:hypothetical protein